MIAKIVSLKLLAVDGLSIVRRVYEANSETNAAAKADAALRHSLSSFRKLLALHQPSHVLPAFDFGGSTWRHALYPRYREHCEPMPAALKDGLPGFYEKLAALGLTVVSVPGAETDDMIATATLRWLREGRGEAVVASTDKDLHVLIAQGALLWDYFKREWHDRAWVEKKFGVPPEMLPDLFALMGDVADGIPGVSKIGVKTGAKLLRAYGSLDAVMNGAGILKGPLGETLRKERDLAYLSRQLVELKTDVQLAVSWKKLAYQVHNGD